MVIKKRRRGRDDIKCSSRHMSFNVYVRNIYACMRVWNEHRYVWATLATGERTYYKRRELDKNMIVISTWEDKRSAGFSVVMIGIDRLGSSARFASFARCSFFTFSLHSHTFGTA